MYSFFCKDCGDYFFSEDRDEVVEYKKKHKIVSSLTFQKYCPLQMTKRKTFARPKLAILIDAEVALEKSLEKA